MLQEAFIPVTPFILTSSTLLFISADADVISFTFTPYRFLRKQQN